MVDSLDLPLFPLWYYISEMSLRIENSRSLAHFTVVASMQRARVSNAWQPFNGPISRVNLPLFTLIVRKCKDKISETFIVRSWTWVFSKNVSGNITETRTNGNVITEMWRKHDHSFPTRKPNGNASRPWKTRSPSFRREETWRYFVLNNNTGKIMFK